MSAVDPDAARRSRLRRMRTVATGLLVVAGVIYAVTLHQGGALGYVNSAAEASMVGAFADWFAVTALFRHPLRLPIPHTALIPKRKDEFGASLQDFFTENFLREEVVRERLADADIVGRVARWTEKAENAERVVAETASVLTIAIKRMRDEDIKGLVEDVIIPRLSEEPLSPVVGSLLAEVLADKAHVGVVDLGLEEALRWLHANHDTFTAVLAERAPWWAPERLNEAVTTRLHAEAIDWLEDIRRDPYHHARFALDTMLRQLSDDLLNNPETQQRAEAFKSRVLAQPQVVATGLSLWEALRRAFVDALDDPLGPLRERGVGEVRKFAARVETDPEMRARLEGWLSDLAVWAIGRYGNEVSAIISHTIQRWDGVEAAEKIELHVGPDLQFIRINGTIVGGLVGLLIHTATVVAT